MVAGYQYIKKAEHGGVEGFSDAEKSKNLLDFSVNLNPCAPELDYSLTDEKIRRYPDDEYKKLKSIIAKHHRRNPDEICVGNGSVEVIRTLCHTVLKAGTIVQIPSHTFSEYALSVQLAGGQVSHDPKAQADLTFLCNPDNPSGLLLSRTSVIQKLNQVEGYNGLLCVDEAFIDLADPKQSVSDLMHSSLFILRSLTKSFSMAGVRFGYGIGDPDLIAAMEVMRPPWNINALAESMAIQAFERYDELEKSRQYIQSERERISKFGLELGLKPSPASANFVLFETSNDVKEIVQKMHNFGIIIRDCHSFGLPSCFRVAVKTRKENDLLLGALEQCLR